jgi:small basic protein
MLAVRVEAKRRLLCELRDQTIGVDYNMTIPQDIQAQINLALATLPTICGKVSLHLEFNCGTSGHVASLVISVTRQEFIKAQ